MHERMWLEGHQQHNSMTWRQYMNDGTRQHAAPSLRAVIHLRQMVWWIWCCCQKFFHWIWSTSSSPGYVSSYIAAILSMSISYSTYITNKQIIIDKQWQRRRRRNDNYWTVCEGERVVMNVERLIYYSSSPAIAYGINIVHTRLHGHDSQSALQSVLIKITLVYTGVLIKA